MTTQWSEEAFEHDMRTAVALMTAFGTQDAQGFAEVLHREVGELAGPDRPDLQRRVAHLVRAQTAVTLMAIEVVADHPDIEGPELARTISERLN